MNTIDESKKLVGEAAVEYVTDGMKIGIGSGSTVYWMVKKLGERVQQGLQVVGVPTSNTTAQWAEQFGVPLTDFATVQELDLAIDGADEVDEGLNLIKGGGGALLREKIVAASAKKFIIIADHSKMVSQLGRFPLAVEVTPFGWEVTAKKIAAHGCTPVLRKEKNEVFITDNDNYILDCNFEQIPDPKKLHSDLISLVGVVETGLFTDMATKVLVGHEGKVEIVEK
ncbi:ribose-5-phosphate isomerase RpiA [Oceanobacillus massiliensis]|uniref:ribose-5-phosphate isomerase RpiA n=1 Tax=Oceanobacillus massiliensis TaxID=1465765 RepID=UPI000287B934|nr:ribose-5-phosphate isomerase RpiA [Oceanobacillus massiliensis]